MPHPRLRYATEIIKKKLKFAPIVTIQGARQTGKSFLVREILTKDLSSLSYRSLDDLGLRTQASSNPRAFLFSEDPKIILAVDEAQKSPELFDTVKLLVDQDKRPGRFIFLGSTEFSHMWNIREALTGRISRVRIHPLTVSETLSKKLSKSSQAFYLSSKPDITRNDLLKYLSSGGLPGIFAIRNISERTNRLKDWVELSCFRDIKNIPVGKYDGDLCLRILEGVARLEEPDLPAITKYVKRDRRIVFRHLEALKSLFVLNVLSPHPLGTGKDLYFIFDVGLLDNLGGDFEKKLWTWSLNEILAKYSYTENYQKRLFYYRARNGGIVHLVEENVRAISALKLLPAEKFSSLDLRILTALRAKSKSEINLFAAGSTNLSLKEDKIQIYPWESLA